MQVNQKMQHTEQHYVVRCSKCGQAYSENEVPHIHFEAATVGELEGEGCDNCGTDRYLTDIPVDEAIALGYIH